MQSWVSGLRVLICEGVNRWARRGGVVREQRSAEFEFRFERIDGVGDVEVCEFGVLGWTYWSDCGDRWWYDLDTAVAGIRDFPESNDSVLDCAAFLDCDQQCCPV